MWPFHSHEWLEIPVNPYLVLREIVKMYPDKNSRFGREINQGLNSIGININCYDGQGDIEKYITNKHTQAGMCIYYIFSNKNLEHMSPIDGNWFIDQKFRPKICRICGKIIRNDIKLLNHLIDCGNFIDDSSHPHINYGFKWVDKIIKCIDVKQIRFNFQYEFEMKIEELFNINYEKATPQRNID